MANILAGLMVFALIIGVPFLIIPLFGLLSVFMPSTWRKNAPPRR
jgi:F0F1-type ATP synthase membrane subunit a